MENNSSQSTLTEQEKAELSEFVAGKMFSGLQFNQVLLLIENQCRAQAKQTIEQADAETIAKIQEDFFEVKEKNEILGSPVIKEGAVEQPDFSNVPEP